MERYNIFNLIHKALRASLYQTALQLQQTDFTSAEEAEAAINKVREIIMLFEAHAHKEDHFILPAINEYEPSVVASFESEHQKDEQLAAQLSHDIAQVEKAFSYLEKLIAGRHLNETFVAFTVFNLQHMAREEDVINKILWRYYTDEEIRKISGQITASVDPWMHDFYSTWMLRGISNPEATNWMKTVEKFGPPVVFKTLLQKAGRELPKGRFMKISQSLGEVA